MKFGISNNVKSRVVRECTPELLRQALDSPLVARVCAEIEDALEAVRRGEMSKDDFETLKAARKKMLPVITPHATFRSGRRTNAEAVASGLSMYDVDHINDPRGYWEQKRQELEARGVELGYFNFVDEDVMVIADAEQLKRVINNIIGNSLKYMDKKHGIINIRLLDVGDFVQIEIEDNGKGIGQKELPYIFDRFYRTDSSRTSSKGGSGIGLSIVKKIVEDHGGRIWATSKEGVGTEIHFVLRKIGA